LGGTLKTIVVMPMQYSVRRIGIRGQVYRIMY
jgi:hypothetical protein